jgi:hypothetical protein
MNLTPDATLFVQFKIRNFGKSPAWITRLQVKFTTINVGTDFPEIPDYTNRANAGFRGVSGRMVQPDTPIQEGCPFALDKFSESDYEGIIKGNGAYFWIFGLVNYEDFLGESHETAFSAQYQISVPRAEGMWVANAGPDAYHYHDRKHREQSKKAHFPFTSLRSRPSAS